MKNKHVTLYSIVVPMMIMFMAASMASQNAARAAQEESARQQQQQEQQHQQQVIEETGSGGNGSGPMYIAGGGGGGAGSIGSVCAGDTISQTLSTGSSGHDVIELQRILNIDPATEIAAAGAGSPGQETQYFGALTFNAVERFQEKYASEILFPLKLKSPTGVVGSATRLWLKQLCPF